MVILSNCCRAPVEDIGTCRDGCCDKERCSKCDKTWLVEGAD